MAADKESRGFVVYDELKAVIDELDDEQVGQLFRGMLDYHCTGEEPGFIGLLKFIFIPIKQGIDRNDERYAKTCERNKINALKRWEGSMRSDAVACDGMRSDAVDANKRKENKIKEKETKEKETKQKSTEVDVWSLSRSVLSYLNDKAGTNYKTDAADSVRLISELYHNGYSETDMVSVIDNKVSAWLGDPKVEQYLRPSTLFGPKFEQYLQEPDTVGREARRKESEREERRNKARSDMERYERELSELQSQYDATETIRERIDIKGSIAVLEAKMEAARAGIGVN